MSKNLDDVSFPEEGFDSFPERLKEIIGTATLKDFAAAVGISQGGLRKYLPPARSVPSFDKVARFARYSGVSLEWLSTGEGEKYALESNSSQELGKEFALIDGYHSTIDQISDDEHAGEVRRRLAFRKKWLSWRGFNPDNLKVFFVKSAVEGGLINGGDTVMIDFADRVLSDGAFALKLKGATVIRWLVVKVDGGVDVHADMNQASIESLSETEADKLNLLGRVVWLGKDLS
ncbi:helix-turn-helix domain-containing protein [Enterovibrio baiacu]|uniref:helix-turn-helix domain-containing protein n=1 Tax=Enterovibrio baiacu TaxID=2491023 RepID=UPI003D130344